MKRILSAIITGALIAGCQSSGDPREGGLMGGIQGIMGGGYEQRLQDRDQRLQEEEAASRQLDEQGARLAAERQAAQQVLRHERTRLDRLSADTRDLERQVAALGEESGYNEQQLADLQQRLTVLKQQLGRQGSRLDALEGDADGASSEDLRRAQLETQRRALQQEYETLLELTLQLAR